jgi:hypothetical protein
MLSSNRFASVALLLVASAIVGCGANPQASPVASTPVDDSNSQAEHSESNQAAITEAFTQLSPEDRLLAESQKFCAVATENSLGSMGVPLRIEVNGEPVFLCCAGCKDKAFLNPEETLASVAKLKSENSISK